MNQFINEVIQIIKLWDSKNPKGLGNSKNFQRDIKNKKEFKFTPFPKFALDLIKAGGLLNYVKNH